MAQERDFCSTDQNKAALELETLAMLIMCSVSGLQVFNKEDKKLAENFMAEDGRLAKFGVTVKELPLALQEGLEHLTVTPDID